MSDEQNDDKIEKERTVRFVIVFPIFGTMEHVGKTGARMKRVIELAFGRSPRIYAEVDRG